MVNAPTFTQEMHHSGMVIEKARVPIIIIYLLLISRTLQGYNADVQLHVYNFH